MNARLPAYPAAVLAALLAALVARVGAAQQAAEPDAAPSQAAAAAESDTLPPLRRARDTLIGIRDFNAALNPAQTIVDAQAAEHGPEYVADLAALALVQAELKDIDPAESHFLEAIELVSKEEGEYALDLVDLYRGLGRTYIRAARYPEAIAALELGQHVSQRNLGLFNVEQSPILDDITTAYLGLGDTTKAHQAQLDRLENAVRRYGADDLRVVPFRYTLANYYERSRLPESASEQYEAVIKTQESELGDQDAALMAPLRQLARIDLLIRQGEDTERRDRLATLLDEHPEADSAERGLTLATLGDWATVTGDTAAARDLYRRAWNALAEKPELDVASYFAKPAMIDFIAPLSPVDRNARSRPYTWSQVVLEFDVSADGEPSHVEIADSPSGQLATLYGRRLEETHFRPRLVDGEPVATTDVRSTQYFRVYVEKPRRRGRKNDDEADEADEGDEAAD
jgi:tetratricopeptide (TPR) repeat protein